MERRGWKGTHVQIGAETGEINKNGTTVDAFRSTKHFHRLNLSRLNVLLTLTTLHLLEPITERVGCDKNQRYLRRVVSPGGGNKLPPLLINIAHCCTLPSYFIVYIYQNIKTRRHLSKEFRRLRDLCATLRGRLL